MSRYEKIKNFIWERRGDRNTIIIIIIIQLLFPEKNSLPFRKKFDRSKHWTGIFLRLFYHEGGYEARVTTQSVDDFTMDVSSVG